MTTHAPTLRLFPEIGREKRSNERGVLPAEHLRQLVADSVLTSEVEIEDGQFQPASIDLRLGRVAYQVTASLLPGRNATVMESVEDVLMQELDLTSGTVLVAGCVYIIPLLESVALPPTLSGKANPKSTTGRLDVFARTITDYSENFDTLRRGYRGPLFVEVSPQTFSVFARTGDRLNQLRVRRSLPDEFHETTKAARAGGDEHLIWNEDGEPIKQMSVDEGLWFSVDTARGFGDGIVGWRARRNSRVLDLRQIRHYPIRDFWEPVPSCPFMTLEVGCFYILASKERVLVPPSYAAEMVAYDNAVGEFRVHYAGFFDPGFGYSKEGPPGTRAVLEVRSHEIPYILKDGQPVGRLQFEPMLAIPEKLYGEGSGSNYQDQGLGLAKQFRRD